MWQPGGRVRCVGELDNVDLAPRAVDRLSVEKVLREQCVVTPATGGGGNQRAEQAGKQQQTAAYEGPAIARRTRAGVALPRQRCSTASHATPPALSPFPRFLSASAPTIASYGVVSSRNHRITEDYERSSSHGMLVRQTREELLSQSKSGAHHTVDLSGRSSFAPGARHA